MSNVLENALEVAALKDRDLFYWLCGHQEKGVPGVLRIKRGNPTTSGIILAGSHGNEIPSGISVLRTLLLGATNLVADIDLTVAVGNIDAAQNFFAVNDPDEQAACRFTPKGRDMNRLSMDDKILSGARRIREYVRATALRRVLGVGVDKRYVLDVHSTDCPSEPSALGIVGTETATMDLVRHLPVSEVITNVVAIQGTMGTKTRTLSSIFDPTVSLEVETGHTGSPQAKINAASIYEAWAGYLGFITGGAKPYTGQQRLYRVVNSVMAPDTTYQVAEGVELKEFTAVKRGQVLLRNSTGDEILAPCDGLVIWGPAARTLTPTNVASEIWFIVEAVN